MEDGECLGEPFAIPDLWAPSRFVSEIDESGFLFPQLQFDDDKIRLPAVIELARTEDGFFSLPDISFGIAEDVKTPSSSVDAEQEKEGKPSAAPVSEEDIWRFVPKTSPEPLRFVTWDSFWSGERVEHQTSYLSESGAEVFDAALAHESDPLHLNNTDTVVIISRTVAASLTALGLGRDSALFKWSASSQSFEPTMKGMRVSGCSSEVTGGLFSLFNKCGNLTRFLYSFVEKTYLENVSACRIALANAIHTLLKTLQTELHVPEGSLKSFVQLQELFRPAEAILTSFSEMVRCVENTTRDEDMLSILFQEIARHENRTDFLRDVSLEVFSRVSQPFLDFVAEWMGLQEEFGVPLDKSGPGKSFIKVEERSWIDEQGMELHEPEFVLDYERIPSFLPVEQARVIFELGCNVRFLRMHHKGHPLASTHALTSVKPPTLRLEFSWDKIENIAAKAIRYEKDLTDIIRQYSIDTAGFGILQIQEQDTIESSPSFDIFGKAKEEVESHVLASMATLSQPPSDSMQPDQLTKLVVQNLHSQPERYEEIGMFPPPMSLTPLLSFSSIIAAQARMCNYTSVYLFFKTHNLREHLSIQRRFHLLGDGVFSSRLSNALFDPELETAERQAGIVRTGGTMGLRLGGRDTWPPASSELRLALMGILSESFVSKARAQDSTAKYHDNRSQLPGDLSFAVRDMSESEIEKVKDPHSIEALDFLRLSYKPPSPLGSIITPLSLHKYDQLFRFLLRISRMLYLTSRLVRVSTSISSQPLSNIDRRFRFEAYHFISCLSSYVTDVGISAPWQRFESVLDATEARITTNMTLKPDEGIDGLCALHSRVLDRMLAALLLRKRQAPVMGVLNEIFGTILQFSVARGDANADEDQRNGRTQELYTRFRKKIDVFLMVCRGMCEKREGKEKREAERNQGLFGLADAEMDGEAAIVQLLLRLEMSDYYSQPVKI